MAKTGPRFLEHTRHEFLDDLMNAFGEKSDNFTEDLKVLLFELWVRARSRAPFPEHRPEPTEEMKQAEFRKRFSDMLQEAVAPSEIGHTFIKAVQRSITVGAGIVRFDGDGALNLQLDPTYAALYQSSFADMLNQVLKTEGILQKSHDLGTNEVTVSVSRVRAAFDAADEKHLVRQQVDTMLTHDGAHWLLPNPKPVNTPDKCPHVQLWVDGVKQDNDQRTWLSEFQWSTGLFVVGQVFIPTAVTPYVDQVRATYSTVVKEYGT